MEPNLSVAARILGVVALPTFIGLAPISAQAPIEPEAPGPRDDDSSVVVIPDDPPLVSERNPDRFGQYRGPASNAVLPPELRGCELHRSTLVGTPSLRALWPAGRTGRI